MANNDLTDEGTRRPPLQLTLAAYSRSERHPGLGPFEGACSRLGIPGYGELVWVEQRTADDLMAGQLEIQPGDPYIHRRRYMHIGTDDKIIQIQEGSLPLSIVEGTPLAGQDKVIEGTYAALDAIGHGPATVTHQVGARPMAHEESLIFIPRASGVPVITIVRTTRDKDGTVVEVMNITALADQNVFLYEDLPID